MRSAVDRKKQAFRIFIFSGIVILTALFWYFDFYDYLTLENLKEHRTRLERYYNDNPLKTSAMYLAVYIFTAASSLPGAVILTLAGGALFGLTYGTIIVSIASTTGASLAFLASRFLLRDYIDRKFGSKLKTINRGIEKDGSYYLLSLRLTPVFPFFMINILMGLTSIRLRKFFIISQIGMLPGTIIYIFAGVQLSKIDSPQNIMSPGLFFALFAAAVFPLVAKKVMDAISARKTQGNER